MDFRSEWASNLLCSAIMIDHLVYFCTIKELATLGPSERRSHFRCSGGVEQRLPFELKMLEGALENIVCELATEVQELMEKASPALDALVSRVRRILASWPRSLSYQNNT